jgi:hypothetical protein
VYKAEGSFIFASTLFNFLTEEGGMYLHQRIGQLSGIGLDALYHQVISGGGGITHPLAAVILLNEPMSISSLSILLSMHPSTVVGHLLKVQSIVLIPGDDHSEVRILHTSLRDYLTSEHRSLDLYVDPSFHILLAICCLRAMEDHSDLKDGMLFKKGNGHQWYAVRYGAQHIWKAWEQKGAAVFSSYFQELHRELKAFILRSYLVWSDTVFLQLLQVQLFLAGQLTASSSLSILLLEIMKVFQKVQCKLGQLWCCSTGL